MNKINYNDWNSSELKNQIKELSMASPMSFRQSDKLIELRKGEIRIKTMSDDKSWSDWEIIEAPHLNVEKGKIIANRDHGLIIRISTDEAHELCSIKDEPWSNDDAMNAFNSGSGNLLIRKIINGSKEFAELLTTRKTLPNVPFQVELANRMGLTSKPYSVYSGNVRKMYEDADKEYISDNWIGYFPYQKMNDVWTPAQELVYLESLLKRKSPVTSKPKVENKDRKHSIKPNHILGDSDMDLSQENVHNNISSKSYITAALLAIFLGFLGAHKFYVGKKVLGIIYLLFSWTMIPSVLGVIEGLKILIEGQDKFIEQINDF